MSLKDLFESTKPSPSSSADQVSYDAESEAYIESYIIDRDTFIPSVDFSTASNFAKFGSAEKYYADAITRIHDQYPYDGSLREKTDFQITSSYLDRWIFDNRYPRTTGYVNLGTTSGSGDWSTMVSGSSEVGGWGMPDTSDNNILEYIEIKGGPHTGSADRTFEKQETGLKKLWDYSNVYNSGSARESNLEFDLRTGMTVEFWMLKNDFYTSKTEREVIFDLWNNANSSSAGYGRVMIELSGTSVSGESVIRLTAQSGTTGFVNEGIATITKAQVADGIWKHYAVTLKNSADGDGINAKLYVNGQLSGSSKLGSAIVGRVTGSLTANIGALRAPPSGATGYYDTTTIAKGGAKLSASIDEFRYWKLERDAREIGRNWWNQVGGGTNTDPANVGLGVYYKFNEGIMHSGSHDRTVIDYSGRISNGFWQGGISEVRNTGSAITSGSHNGYEFHDPIIYNTHEAVVDLKVELQKSGSYWDKNNNAMLFHNFPAWTAEEEREDSEVLKEMTQIMASYFDKLWLQIDALGKLKDRYATAYTQNAHSASNKPLPFANKLVKQMGIATPEILQEAEFIESFLDRSESKPFAERVSDVRNQIYSNIYANLLYIFKSKGTEKSFRNMLRCFGIDDELVKLNMYADNSDYVFKDNRRATTNKTNYVSFTGTDRSVATIYQAMSTSAGGTYSNPHAAPYITGSSTFGKYLAQTIEAEIYFPEKPEKDDLDNWYADAFFTSSLFGAQEAVEDYTNLGFAGVNNVDLRVHAIKEDLESKRAYFQVSSSILGLLTSSYYEDVYDDTRWNFAVRVKPDAYPWADHVSGSDSTYTVEFYGVNTFTDTVQQEFLLSASVSNTLGTKYLAAPKRCYVGALRQNFTSSTVLHYCNVEVGNLRYWMSDLPDKAVLAHAFDESNFGTMSPYENVFLFQTDMSGVYVPQIETLALHWNFDNVTGSDAGASGVANTQDAQFIVQDFSSGSAEHGDRYKPSFSPKVEMQHLGVGDFFLANKTDVVNTRYIPTAKTVLPEYVYSSDMVEIRQRDDEFFNRDTRPSKFFYALEKSMYQTISEEMIKMFATVTDFNNLIGEPVNRYRHEYKDMAKLRQLFFEGMPNTPNLDKYVDYYKWIDSAVGRFIEQLMPASARTSKGLRTMVESHVLERSKYQTKFPSLEMKMDDPEGAAEGINKNLYNYKYGHAPVPTNLATGEQNESENCLWWSKRAQRYNPNLSSSVSGANTSRVGVFSASAQTFTRQWVTPYKYSVNQRTVIHGGINFDDNKKLDYVYPATVPFSPRPLDYGIFGGYPLGYLLAKDMDIDASPSASLVDCDIPRSSSYGGIVKREGYKVIDGWESFKAKTGGQFVAGAVHTPGWESASYTTFRGNLVMPFNVISSSHTDVNEGYTQLINQDLTVYVGSGVGHPTTAGTHINKIRGSIQQPPSETTTKVGGLGRGLNLVNLHTDTYGEDKELPLQGPFTEKYVGGRAYRHSEVNDGTHTLKNRQEGFLVLINVAISASDGVLHANSGGVGLAGADYPYPHGPYPFAPDQWDNWRPIGGRYYRDETAKRPVNIRNIQMKTSSIDDALDSASPDSMTGYQYIGTHRHDIIANDGDANQDWTYKYHEQIATGSATTIIGNYRKNYEVVHTVGRSNQRPFLRDNQSVRNIEQTASFAEAPSLIATGADNAPRALGTGTGTKVSDPTLLPATTHVESILTQKFQASSSTVASGPPEHQLPTDPTNTVLEGARVIVAQISGGVGGATSGTASLDNYKILPTPDEHIYMDHTVQSRETGSTNLDTIFANKFSAPGGPRNQSKGFLDLAAEEYSVYNAYPWRNLEVLGSSSGEYLSTHAQIHSSSLHPRLGLQSLRRMPGGKFGLPTVTSGATAGTYDTPAAWHKVNRNPRLEYRNIIVNSKATATLTFGTSDLTANQTIIILSTDGTTKTYTSKASDAASSLQFTTESDAYAHAIGLKAAIEHANGHNGKITVAHSAGVLTLTQAVEGIGKSNITNSVSGITVTQFANGRAYDTTEKVVYDNDYVTRVIPRSDFQYAWISASLAPSSSESSLQNLGHGYHYDWLFEPTPSGSRPVDPITFISASTFGSAIGNTTTHQGVAAAQYYRFFGIDRGLGNAQHIPTVHRLNLNIIEEQNNWLTDASGAVALGYFATGGILPADEKHVIDSDALGTRHGGAYGSQIANLWNYINIQLSTTSPDPLPVGGVNAPLAAADMDAIFSQGPRFPGPLGGGHSEPLFHRHLLGRSTRFDNFLGLPTDYCYATQDPGCVNGAIIPMAPVLSSESHGSEPTDAPQVKNYFERQSGAGIFNALMWKRNGPFGYPSWRQTRGGEHVLAMAMRENNRYVLVDPASDRIENPKPGRQAFKRVKKRGMKGKDAVQAFRSMGHINTAERKHNHYTVPVLDTTAKSLITTIQIGSLESTVGQETTTYSTTDDLLYVNNTYQNNIANFPISQLNKDVGLDDYNTDRQAYDDIYELYTEKTNLAGDDAYTLVNLVYRQTIFPKPEHVGIKEFRMRDRFDVGYWAADGDDWKRHPKDDVNRQSFYDPIGRRFFRELGRAGGIHRDKQRGGRRIYRGRDAGRFFPRFTAAENGGIITYGTPLFNENGTQITQHQFQHAWDDEFGIVTIMESHGSVWPMDGAWLTVMSPENMGQNDRCSSSFDAKISDDLIHYPHSASNNKSTAQGLFQNVYTIFHNGISNIAEAASRTNSDAASTALQTWGFRPISITGSDTGRAGTRERVVINPAGAAAFSPLFSRPHTLVGRNSYCAPSAGKAAVSRRLLFNKELGTSSYGKGADVDTVYHDLASPGTLNNVTIPYTASHPSLTFEGVVAELTRSIGHTVEGLYTNDVPWTAPNQSGKAPFYDTYAHYFEDMRGKSKDRQILPEYRISDRIEYFVVDKQGRFTSKDEEWLSILGNPSSSHGGPLTSSAHTNTVGSAVTASFMKDYAITAEAGLFEPIYAKHKEITDPYQLTLTVDALIKFLPYDGFYPQLRCADLCEQFISSYDKFVDFKSPITPTDMESYVMADGSGSLLTAGQEQGDEIQADLYSHQTSSFDLNDIYDPTCPRVGGNRGEKRPLSKEGVEKYGRNAALAKRPFYTPFMAPGILFNTIKSGIAVDYPVLNYALAVTASVDRDGGRNYQILNEYFDNRVPFEALVEPERYLKGMELIDMECHPSAAINVTCSWNGRGDPLYKMMAHNFLAEIPSFFLVNGGMQSFVSLPESHPDFGNVTTVVESGQKVIPEYRMMVKLWKSQEDKVKELPPSASNHWVNHRGPKGVVMSKAHDGSSSGSLKVLGVYAPCYMTDYLELESRVKYNATQNLYRTIGVEGGKGRGIEIDEYRRPDGQDYVADEVLYPRPQNDAPETITMYSRPSAFGPPCAGGYAFSPRKELIYTGSAAPMSMSNNTDVASHHDLGGHGLAVTPMIGAVAHRQNTTWGMKDSTNGYNAPFTPPYYDGQAWALVTFKPTKTGKHSLDEIWQQTTINYLRYELDYVSGAYGDWGTYGPQGLAINTNAMQVDSSVNMKSRTQIKQVEYEALTGRALTVSDVATSDSRLSAWVIQTKMETPILHFGYGLTDNQAAPTLSGSTAALCLTSSANYYPGFPGLCEAIGMWHQYGEIPSASQGIYLEIADLPDSYIRYGTELTIANPKWLNITGSPDVLAGCTAGMAGTSSTDGALDWDGILSGTYESSVVYGHDGIYDPQLYGHGFRFSGSLSGSEDAVVAGLSSRNDPTGVTKKTLQTDAGQYLRWRLMSTGSLAGLVSDMAHLQIVSTEDGTILDTAWHTSADEHPVHCPGLSGSALAFERGFYLTQKVTGANVVANPARATGHPGTSSIRMELMGMGKMATAVDNNELPFVNYYEQWNMAVNDNGPTERKAASRGYLSPLHKNKRGVIPDSPDFTNNIHTSSFGTELGFQIPGNGGLIIIASTDGLVGVEQNGYNTANFATGNVYIGGHYNFPAAEAGSAQASGITTTNQAGVRGWISYVSGYTSSLNPPNTGSGPGIDADVPHGGPGGPPCDVVIDRPLSGSDVQYPDGTLLDGGFYGATWYKLPDTGIYMADTDGHTSFAAQGTHPYNAAAYNGNMTFSGVPVGTVTIKRAAADSSTAVTFTAASGLSTTAGAMTFRNANAATAAGDLATLINHANGHGGYVYATNPTTTTVRIRYLTGGPAPNTAMVDDCTNFVINTQIGGETATTGSNAIGLTIGEQDIYPVGHSASSGTGRISEQMRWYMNTVYIANLRMTDVGNDRVAEVNSGLAASLSLDGNTLSQTFPEFPAKKPIWSTPKISSVLQDALHAPRTVYSGKYLPRGGSPSLTGSLADLVGFDKDAVKLGQLAETKTVKEAVIAMPYVIQKGRRQFVELDTDQLDRYFGRNDYKDASKWKLIEEAQDSTGTAISPESGLQVNLGTSVLRQIRLMDDYVIPPHLDFTRNSRATPYAMYVFEFEHTFSAQDLADMWQGLLPDSAKTMKQTTKSVTHDLNVLELLGGPEVVSGKKIPSKIRFMVFKVKQRAEINYFAKTIDSSDDARFKFKFRTGGTGQAPDWSYNWPYDFFSLVETAKIDLSISLRNKKLIEKVELEDLSETATVTSKISILGKSMTTLISPIAETSFRTTTKRSSASIKSSVASVATTAISTKTSKSSAASATTPSISTKTSKSSATSSKTKSISKKTSGLK